MCGKRHRLWVVARTKSAVRLARPVERSRYAPLSEGGAGLRIGIGISPREGAREQWSGQAGHTGPTYEIRFRAANFATIGLSAAHWNRKSITAPAGPIGAFSLLSRQRTQGQVLGATVKP
jgi:hypothetical protein